MVVVLWLVPLMPVVGRGGVDGWLGALLCPGMTGGAVRCAGEQRRETDRYDRTDLSGPPGQLGEAAKPHVPRGIRGMAGPQWVTRAGAGIVVCPSLPPEWRRVRGIGRLAGNRWLGRIVRRPMDRTALQVAAARYIAVGVVGIVVLRCPAGRARMRGRGNGRLAEVVLVLARGRPLRVVVLALAGGCPVGVMGLPGPVACRWFIAVSHIRQHSTAPVKGS